MTDLKPISAEPYGRCDTMSDDPGWRERISHRLRFMVPYEKPCGCKFWCDRELTHPVNFPETEIHGRRYVETAVVEYTDATETRSEAVAECTCGRCGGDFTAYIPFSKWSSVEWKDERDPDAGESYIRGRRPGR